MNKVLYNCKLNIKKDEMQDLLKEVNKERYKLNKLIPDDFLIGEASVIMLVQINATLKNDVKIRQQVMYEHYEETDDHVILTTEGHMIIPSEKSKWRSEKYSYDTEIPKHKIEKLHVWYADFSFKSKEIEFINSEYDPEKENNE